MRFDTLPRGRPNTTPATDSAPRALWMDKANLDQSPFWKYEAGKVFLGQTEGDQTLGIRDNRHLLTVAGSRAGKGRDCIIPNLLLYTGSVLVLDPKGENATLTWDRRGSGDSVEAGGMDQEVFILDPFRTADVPGRVLANWNPLSTLDPLDPLFVDDCTSIADALIIEPPGSSSANPYFTSAARIVLRGFIAWVADNPDDDPRDLNTVRKLLYLPPEATDEDGEKIDGAFFDLLERMSESATDDFIIGWGLPAEAANMLLTLSLKERGTIMATVRQHIAFLSSPPMQDLLADRTGWGDDRSPNLKAWKKGGMSIFLCLPAGRMHSHSRFFRLFIDRLLAAVESSRVQADVPALMILDEMHVLGRMEQLETAAGLFAGFGVRIWSIWQDINQLKNLYGDRWETFLGNASIFQSFGLNDLTSLKYVSERLGVSSMLKVNQSQVSGEQQAQGFSGQSRSVEGTALLSPDEIAYFFSRQAGNQLILYPGADPIFCRRLSYDGPAFARLRHGDQVEAADPDNHAAWLINAARERAAIQTEHRRQLEAEKRLLLAPPRSVKKDDDDDNQEGNDE